MLLTLDDLRQKEAVRRQAVWARFMVDFGWAIDEPLMADKNHVGG